MSRTYAPTTGGILKRSFKLLGTHFVSVLLISFLILLIRQGVTYLLAYILAPSPDNIVVTFGTMSITGNPDIAGNFKLLSYFSDVIFMTITSVFVFLKLLGPYMNGNPRQSLTTGQALRNAISLRTVSYYFLTIIYLLMSLLGFIFLIIPGIIVNCMYAPSLPLFLAQNKGIIASLHESKKLTKGHRWTVFFVLILFTILLTVLAFSTSFLGAFLLALYKEAAQTTVHPLIEMLPASIAMVSYLPFVIAVQVAVYLTLHEHKEMVDLERQVQQIETLANPEGFTFDASEPPAVPAENEPANEADSEHTPQT